ncbi:unnamed protein product [Prorocentrum cordatum]|uniref:Electron transfer flavoprotein alpha/beta-subunit N-terminal domain-containing protein n=1 Tax=Prorocentrum cordatum TaxID=2364126 RepID=A0ABN9RIF5_9DINO|nr:unnamed protein product [Polarella glacialis]
MAAALRGLARRCATSGRGYATLVVAEHDNKVLNKATLHALAAASQLPGSTSLDLLVLGKGCGKVAEEGAAVAGVAKVLLAESEQLHHPVADTTAAMLLALQKEKGYSVIAGVSGSFCKEMALDSGRPRWISPSRPCGPGPPPQLRGRLARRPCRGRALWRGAAPLAQAAPAWPRAEGGSPVATIPGSADFYGQPVFPPACPRFPYGV